MRLTDMYFRYVVATSKLHRQICKLQMALNLADCLYNSAMRAKNFKYNFLRSLECYTRSAFYEGIDFNTDCVSLRSPEITQIKEFGDLDYLQRRLKAVLACKRNLEEIIAFLK